jgi:hypothetical protein
MCANGWSTGYRGVHWKHRRMLTAKVATSDHDPFPARRQVEASKSWSG